MKQFIIGIDLGGTNIKSAIFNSDFKTLTEKSVPTEAAMGPDHVMGRIRETIMEMIQTINLSLTDIKCMGMGIPGLLDPYEGLSIFSPNFPDWSNIHVVNRMNTFFDFPTFIDNDVRVNTHKGAFLYAEEEV